MSMKNFPYKLFVFRCVNSRFTIILVCLFVSLLYLHGEPYAQCRRIYPDEIMDLQRFIFSRLPGDEQIICSESREGKQFLSYLEIRNSFIFISYTVKNSFFLECLHLKDLKKRLFTLQRYNS
jgi:hypothetical protein